MTEFSQTYWNDLLEKYRNGTITEQDRFQLEKQALDDPFLFDALEGFSTFQEESKVKRSTKLLTLPRMAIAASLILLVAVIFNLKSNLNTPVEEDQSFAMVMEKDDGVVSDSEEILNTEEPSEDQEESETAITEPNQNVSNKPSKPKKAREESSATTVTNDKKAAVVEIIPPKPPTIIGANSGGFVDGNVELEEVVVGDKKDEELIVSENEVDEAVIANKEDKSIEIVNAANFENLEQEDETEIAPLDIKSKKLAETSEDFAEKAKALSYYKALPVIGKEIFDDFAKQRIDERGLRQEKPQKVTIEFKIDENGNLTDFHHIFTGCSECGPFAITLLQNSGEWETVPPGYSGKARYTFIF